MRRFAFFSVCILFLSGLSWWSIHSECAALRVPILRQESRQELAEWLDRFVAHQHYYREGHGRYSKLVGLVGLPVPPRLANQYEIRVTEAGPDRLRVLAQSDGFVASPDRITIDDEYNIKANFQLPAPRPGYLRYVALKTLRALQAGANVGEGLEKTAFKSFFRYERRMDSRQRVVASAVGEQNPVLGDKLELGPEGLMPESEWTLLSEAFGSGPSTQDFEATRKVFLGELGRAPDSPEELALFAGVQTQPTGLVTRDSRPEPEVEKLKTPLEAEDRAPASAFTTAFNPSKTQGNFRAHGLEIESVPEDN